MRTILRIAKMGLMLLSLSLIIPSTAVFGKNPSDAVPRGFSPAYQGDAPEGTGPQAGDGYGVQILPTWGEAPEGYEDLLVGTATSATGKMRMLIPRTWDVESGQHHGFALTPKGEGSEDHAGISVHVSAYVAGVEDLDGRLGYAGSYEGQVQFYESSYAARGFTLEETTFGGDPGTVIISESQVILLRRGQDGSVYEMFIYSEDADRVPGFMNLASAMFQTVEASGEAIVEFGFETYDDAEDAFYTGASDLCDFEDGTLLESHIVPLEETGVGDFSRTPFFLGERYDYAFRAQPGTTITTQLVDPPDSVESISLSAYMWGWEGAYPGDVLATATPGEQLSYTFDSRPVKYVLWVNWHTDVEPFYLAATCGTDLDIDG